MKQQAKSSDCNKYKVELHEITVTNHSHLSKQVLLLDRGAIGGLFTVDVCIINKTGRLIVVAIMDKHNVIDSVVATAAKAVSNNCQNKIVTKHQNAYFGHGKTFRLLYIDIRPPSEELVIYNSLENISGCTRKQIPCFHEAYSIYPMIDIRNSDLLMS